MVSQMWQQSPAIMLMVTGLVAFGIYAVVAYFRDRLPEEPPAPDIGSDPIISGRP